MVNRTFRFIGAAYSLDPQGARVEATLGGQIIHSGPVTTIPENFPNWQGFYANDVATVLFEYTSDTEISGSVPLSLRVLSGSIFFQQVVGNYAGGKIQAISESDTSVTALILPEDFYAPVSRISAESDGRENVTIDGVPQNRTNEYDGCWNWVVHENSEFTCDLYIDPTFELVTQLPTMEDLQSMSESRAASVIRQFTIRANNFSVD